MKNIKLGTKLIGGFLITAMVALIIGLVGTYEINKLTGHIHEIGEVRLPSIASLQTLENQIRRIQQSTRTMMSPYLDRETRLNQAKDIEDARVIYREAWDVYEPLPQTAEESKTWEQFVPKVKEAAGLNNQAAQMSEQLIEMDVLNPDKYMGNLQMFTADHYALEAKVGEFLLTGHEFDGGTDPTKCRFGKWMAAYSRPRTTASTRPWPKSSRPWRPATRPRPPTSTRAPWSRPPGRSSTISASCEPWPRSP
jgi:methyl-accepting chemotaxis protein